jgi:hypothetical protein
MFEDRLVEQRIHTRRGATTVVSFALQMMLLGIVLLIPLIFTQLTANQRGYGEGVGSAATSASGGKSAAVGEGNAEDYAGDHPGAHPAAEGPAEDRAGE